MAISGNNGTLRLLTYDNKMVGAEGFADFYYAHDKENKCFIGICPALKLTVRRDDSLNDFFEICEKVLEIDLEFTMNMDRYKDYAQKNNLEIRNIPNLIALTDRKVKLPAIAFVPLESVDELEMIAYNKQ
jgi:hypothetical protein